MDADLLTQVQDAIAKEVYGTTFDKLQRTEASNVSGAAHRAYMTVVRYAKANSERFEIDVKAATPA